MNKRWWGTGLENNHILNVNKTRKSNVDYRRDGNKSNSIFILGKRGGGGPQITGSSPYR